MRIICTSLEDERIAPVLADLARANTTDVSIVRYQNAFALTIWSVDDVAAIRDERARCMSAEERECFLEYAEKQLKADMIERGWYSLDTLLDIYIDSKDVTPVADTSHLTANPQ